MTNEEFHRILDRYLNGESTPEEQKLLEAFYEDRLQNREGIASWTEEERMQAKLKVQRYLQDHIRVTDIKERSPRPRRWLRIAATVAVITGVGFAAYRMIPVHEEASQEFITKTAQRGQKVTVTLPDGSAVKLNSESSVTYPRSFDEARRNIVLMGEAFFEVKKDPDRSFTVRTGDLKTTVLGTSFNISAYPETEHIRVTVATGSVRVETEKAENKTLTSGQQAVFDKASFELSQSDISLEKYLAWRSNTIVFDDIPLSEAVRILERWFDAEIIFEKPSLGDCYIQGTYTDETLLNILESFRFVKGLDHKHMDSGKIMITGNSCN